MFKLSFTVISNRLRAGESRSGKMSMLCCDNHQLTVSQRKIAGFENLISQN